MVSNLESEEKIFLWLLESDEKERCEYYFWWIVVRKDEKKLREGMKWKRKKNVNFSAFSLFYLKFLVFLCSLAKNGKDKTKRSIMTGKLKYYKDVKAEDCIGFIHLDRVLCEWQ